jgi:transcriptional regulator with XRE-family HTH domain
MHRAMMSGKPRISGDAHAVAVDAVELGLTFRAIRRHLGLRQIDVARRAGVSQQCISDVERGHLGDVAFDDADRMVGALGARLLVSISWRGPQQDRLLDERHVAICRRFAELLRRLGWWVIAEVTYAVYGERGSIDLLAWHEPTRTLLVVEVKTEIVSAEETLRRHDAKIRLASRIGRERFGAEPNSVGGLLVVAESMTNRRRVARLGVLMDGAYPARGRTVRDWLKAPKGPLRGLAFTNTGNSGARGAGVSRSRTARPAATTSGGK